MVIRPERQADRQSVDALHAAAFGDRGAVVVDLLADLRRLLSDTAGLSLVAEQDGQVVGHVLFTPALLDSPERLVDVEVLSPVAVSPPAQRRGVGSALIRAGIDRRAGSAVPVVFLEGDPAFYARLGFRPAGRLGFRRPSLRIPEPAFQAVLLPAHEPWMTGTLVYPRPFWDHDAVGLRPGVDPAPGPD